MANGTSGIGTAKTQFPCNVKRTDRDPQKPFEATIEVTTEKSSMAWSDRAPTSEAAEAMCKKEQNSLYANFVFETAQPRVVENLKAAVQSGDQAKISKALDAARELLSTLRKSSPVGIESAKGVAELMNNKDLAESAQKLTGWEAAKRVKYMWGF